MEVVKLNIWYLVVLFVVYLGIHIMIGIWKDNLDKIENPTQDEIENKKFATIAFKWFPAVYLVGVVILLAL